MSELKIYECENRGGLAFEVRFPNMPVISVGAAITSLTPVAANKLSVAPKQSIIFSQKDGVWYIAAVPEYSNLKGMVLRKEWSRKCLSCTTNKRLRESGLQNGLYLMKEPVFIKGIDWFELELIK